MELLSVENPSLSGKAEVCRGQARGGGNLVFGGSTCTVDMQTYRWNLPSQLEKVPCSFHPHTFSHWILSDAHNPVMRHVGQVRWGQRGTGSPWGWCQDSVGTVAVTEAVLTMVVAINMHVMLCHLQSHHRTFSSWTRELICSNVGNTKLGGRKPQILDLLSCNMQSHVHTSKFTLFSWGKHTNICIRFECLWFGGIR